MSKNKLWEIIDDISYRKTGKYSEDLEKYDPFVVDRYFSMFPDTLVFSQVAQEYGLDKYKTMHYDFYFTLVPSRYRRKKWYRNEKDERIKKLMELYKVSEKVAKEYLKVLEVEGNDT